MQADLDLGGFGLKNLGNLTSSNTYNGLIRFPSGLIIMWGNGLHTDGSGVQAITYDTPFPAFTLWAGAFNKASSPPTAFHGTGAYTRFGLSVFSSQSAGVPATSGTAFSWLAIGN